MLIEERGRIVGVHALGPDGPLAIRADLIAADGRHSTLRDAAGLKSIDLGAPMDVLWFRAPRDARAMRIETSGRFDPGRIFIRINRGDYWQCAYVIAKGSFDAVKARWQGFERVQGRRRAIG